MVGLQDVGVLVGRILLALIFVLSGFGKLMNPAGTIAMMAGHGVPLAQVAYGLSILIEFIGALLIIIGFHVRPVALIMFLWFIPVTVLFHVIPHFQALHQGNAMVALDMQAHFMKNISIMGGLLILAAMGAGRLSLDGLGTRPELSTTQRAA